jgi:hypothetical protein
MLASVPRKLVLLAYPQGYIIKDRKSSGLTSLTA